MKKFLFLALGIFLLSQSTVFAQNRGVLSNVWARWYNVTTSGVTVTLPLNSRDIHISNGGANAICVSLKGESMVTSCLTSGTNGITQIAGGDELSLYDYQTASIQINSIGGTASPVSVISTY